MVYDDLTTKLDKLLELEKLIPKDDDPKLLSEYHRLLHSIPIISPEELFEFYSDLGFDFYAIKEENERLTKKTTHLNQRLHNLINGLREQREQREKTMKLYKSEKQELLNDLKTIMSEAAYLKIEPILLRLIS